MKRQSKDVACIGCGSVAKFCKVDTDESKFICYACATKLERCGVRLSLGQIDAMAANQFRAFVKGR